MDDAALDGIQPKDILAALEQSGYLMEQAVASEFLELGYKVRTGAAYEDVETGQSKSRDIDVLAVMEECCFNEAGKLQVSVEFICECKNNRDPVVFLVRPIDGGTSQIYPSLEAHVFPIQRFAVPVEDRERPGIYIVDALHQLGLAEHHYALYQPFNAVQICKVYRDGKKVVANNGDIFTGTFLPVVKQLIARRDGHASWCRSGSPDYAFLFFPLIVVNNPIYAVDVTKSPPSITTVNHVHFQRELDSAATSGTFGVDFVTIGFVKEFASSIVQPFIDRVCNLAMSDPERFTQGQDVDGRPKLAERFPPEDDSEE